MEDKYVTYIGVNLCPDGPSPTEVTKILEPLGWRPVYGAFDYAYQWGDNWGTKGQNWEEYFSYVERVVHHALKGYNLNYYLRTFREGTEGEHYRTYTTY
ncbi:MAG: hypothetical protein E3J35_11030 [Methanomassiliicoccales archaeon]|nr:MAG: hypothetical protein E3J35_11030 [Methanomassiliicoccales archaeon]